MLSDANDTWNKVIFQSMEFDKKAGWNDSVQYEWNVFYNKHSFIKNLFSFLIRNACQTQNVS